MKACQSLNREKSRASNCGQFYQVPKSRSLNGGIPAPVSGNFKFSVFFHHSLAFLWYEVVD